MAIDQRLMLAVCLALSLAVTGERLEAQDDPFQAKPLTAPAASATETAEPAASPAPSDAEGSSPPSEAESEEPAKPAEGEKPPAGAGKSPAGAEKKPEQRAAADESGPAVQRPTTPPEPGDPEQLKLCPDAEGKVRFNFTNQKWLDVLEWLADISNMSLDWQELPGDYLNLITAESYPLDEARDMINRHLLARGYTLLRRGEIMSVVKLDKLNPAMVPWIEPAELDQRDPHEFVKVTFALDWLLAEKAAEELKHLVSQHGKLNALESTNRLEAMDAVVNLQEIRRLLAEEQSDTGEGRLVVPFPLKHTRAADVRELLMQLLGIEEKGKGAAAGQPQPGQQGQPQPQPRPQSRRPGQQPPGKPDKEEPKVNIVADERTNTIYVHAPPDKIAVVRQAIEAIDVPDGQPGVPARNVTRMKVYRLESLDPEPLIKTLKDLGGLEVGARLEVDKQNKAIIAYASLADHVIIASVIDKLDGGARHSEVIQLTDLRAESVARVVDYMMGGGPEPAEAEQDRSDGNRFGPFFSPSRSSSRRRPEEHQDRFRVDAEVKNNRLLLWCNDFELAKVEELLENLRASQQARGSDCSVQVHRLVTLDPEPLIKTLTEMETLGVGTRLEADKQSKAIIAYGSEAEHAKLRELIARLDGSGREFHVISLRRLEADYVAGTVAFMMAGKEEEQTSGYGRSYYYYDYYGRRSSRDQQKKEDEFRVDADVEFNRLLVWANEIEMEEVKKLLVKLGEIPPEGGDPNTLRVLDLPPGPERDQLFEQLRRAWPSLLTNPLLLPEPEQTLDDKTESDEPNGKGKSGATTTATGRAAGVVLVQSGSSPHGAARLNPVSRQPPADQPARESADADSSPEPKTASSDRQDATPPPTAPLSEPSARAGLRDQDGSQQPPPISVSESADGRLVISSQDTRALDRLEALIAELAPPRRAYEVFRLRYAEAYWVALTLEDFFDEGKKNSSSNSYWDSWWGYRPSSSSQETPRRLSKRRPLKFVSDDTTNTILVQGATPDQLRTVRELIELYDQPPMADSDSARKTEIFQIRFAEAATVAEAIKDVYRDLLSENDKALISARKQNEGRHESRYTYIYGLDGSQDTDLERKPRFKGYLSLGVDEQSNTLAVSAPEFLFRDIARLVDEFDEAARPTSDIVHVHRFPGSLDRADIRERLAKILQGPITPAAESHEPQPGEKRAQDGQ